MKITDHASPSGTVAAGRCSIFALSRTMLWCLAVAMAVVLSVPAGAQTGLSVGVAVTGEIPLGPVDPEEEIVYSIGAGGSVSAVYRPAGLPALIMGGGVDYLYAPLISQSAVSILAATVDVGLGVSIAPWLALSVTGSPGYGIGILGREVGGSGFIKATGRINFRLLSALSVSIQGGYRQLLGLYQGYFAGITASLNPQAIASRSKLEIEEIEFLPVFPVFHSYYRNHPMGYMRVTNNENAAIRNVVVTLHVPSYMDGPFECVRLDQLGRGESARLPLFALFSEQILDITEGTTAQAIVRVEYELSGDPRDHETTDAMNLQNRNAMTWDDDNKAASFVTAKDPTVLAFARAFAGVARGESQTMLTPNFRIGLGVLEALQLYGMNYLIDPESSYEKLSAQSEAIDYLQFPYQSLQYRAGDCDDLSILYAALLEASGVETAFITIPGHIYAAFALEIDPDRAQRMIGDSSRVIEHGRKAWIPVEVTALNEGFLEAWRIGAEQWYRHEADGSADLYPVRAAWDTYSPVGFASREAAIATPETQSFLNVFRQRLAELAGDQVGPRIAELEARIARARDKARIWNAMGVVYAQYGLYDRARVEFDKAAAEGHVPAMVNSATIAFMTEDYDNALRLYLNALGSDPRNAEALVGLAKTHHQLERYGEVSQVLDRLRAVDSELANEHSYLAGLASESGRAAEAQRIFAPLWSGEVP